MSDQTTHDTNEPTTSWRDKTLKAAGYGYVIGDVAGIGASLAITGGKKKWATASGFATWLVGGLAAGIYGNPNQEKQLEILAHKLERHLCKQGINIPTDFRSQNELLKDRGFFHSVERFLYEHPSEILNAAYAIGAGAMMHQGWRNVSAGKQTWLPKSLKLEEIYKNTTTDFWSGLLVLVGALGGLFIKEDQHASEKAKDGGAIEKATAYFTEKSLRFPSIMYWLNNVVLFGRIFQEKNDYGHQNVKPHLFSTVTLASYVFSNLMLQFSSRSQIAADLPAEAVDKLEQAAATIIAVQPAKLQAALLADASQFLATQKGVKLPAEDIAEQLAARITKITGARMQHAATAVKSFADSEKQRRGDVTKIQAKI